MRIVVRNVNHATVVKCLMKTGLGLLHFLLTVVFLIAGKWDYYIVLSAPNRTKMITVNRLIQ